ncbi:MAG TPA: YjbH domain-containing protein, partial [Rhizomicrobium sp.]
MTIHQRALRNFLFVCAGAIAPFSFAAAQDAPDAVRTTYGDVGILEMPSARMAPDGQMSVTVGALEGTQRYNLGFQMLPWLEASFRYSYISHIEGLPFVYDRSFGLKVRFWQEGDYIPEVSLGIRDILGTGVYGSEYLVASKSLGDFDVSTGLGWGRLASDDALPNPFGAIIPSFKVRKSAVTGVGGVPDFGQFFHGPNMGVFGGIDWRSPVDGLDFLAEYSSDRYVLETLGGKFHERAPVNVGARYRVSENFSLSAGWFYATSWGLTASFNMDPLHSTGLTRIGPEIPQPAIRTGQQQRHSLAALQARTNQARTATEGGPFVALPPPEQSLNERLASESVGV